MKGRGLYLLSTATDLPSSASKGRAGGERARTVLGMGPCGGCSGYGYMTLAGSQAMKVLPGECAIWLTGGWGKRGQRVQLPAKCLFPITWSRHIDSGDASHLIP